MTTLMRCQRCGAMGSIDENGQAHWAWNTEAKQWWQRWCSHELPH